MRRSVTILGATGSIGTSTLDLIERSPDAFKVRALTAGTDAAKLADVARRTNAELAVIADESRLPDLRAGLADTGIKVAGGRSAVIEAAGSGADWTMAAIVGCAGLEPVMAAVEQGGTVVLANKEPLVSAGEIILGAARRCGATLLPADSEHNAIFQCFDFERPERVRRIILTASGGPFRNMTTAEMSSVSVEQAVAHPVWSMGAKISIDSATLMNKGLELIEAARLFPVDSDRIEIILHPQSMIHSLVEYVDGSVLAQLGSPDMRTPIAHTLAWPDRMETPVAPLDLARIGKLEFATPDPHRFPALRLAREALDAGGAKPAILNAANEVAVAAFLERRIPFLQIAAIVEETLNGYDPAAPNRTEDVIVIDRESRCRAEEVMKVFVD